MGKISILTFILLLGILVLGSCSNNVTDNPSFKSAVAGANGEAGKLSVYINSAAVSSVKINEGSSVIDITGKLELEGGATTDLIGTYDTVTEDLILTGSDYSFVGATTSTNGRISGDYTKGSEPGIFAGFDSSSNEVKVYCGTYTSDVCLAPGCSGVWSATTSSGGYAAGTYYGNDGSSNGTLWGTFIDNTMTGEDDHGSIMTGTIDNGVVTGTWILDDGIETVTGTFEASTESCP